MKSVCPTLVLAGCIAAVAGAADVSWEAAPSLPVASRTGAIGAFHEGTIYVIGGRPLETPDYESPVHYLPPGAAQWETGANLQAFLETPGSGVDPLGRLIVFGGYEPGSPLVNPHYGGYAYDPAEGPGDEIANMIFSWANSAFATDDQHRFYALGGQNLVLDWTRDAQRYLPDEDRWERLSDLPGPSANAASCYDGQGRVLVIGGGVSGISQSRYVFGYEIENATWSMLPSLPVTLRGAASALGADGRVYVVGGVSGSTRQSTTHIFDPVSEEWSLGPPMLVARERPAVAVTDEGYLYVAGGVTNTGASPAAGAPVERLDTRPKPTGATWSLW